jgi:hypothetical protein
LGLKYCGLLLCFECFNSFIFRQKVLTGFYLIIWRKIDLKLFQRTSKYFVKIFHLNFSLTILLKEVYFLTLVLHQSDHIMRQIYQVPKNVYELLCIGRSVSVIIQLLLSLYLGPKVITLSNFHSFNRR